MLLEGVVQLGRERLQTGSIFLGGDDDASWWQLCKLVLHLLQVAGSEVVMIGIVQQLHMGAEGLQVGYHGLGMGNACNGQQMTGGIDGCCVMRIVAHVLGLGKHGLWRTIGDGGEVELLMGQ